MSNVPTGLATVRYSGSSAYCYANALHMALLSAGADPRVLPEVGFLECLTGLPFGNLLILTEHGPLPLFSSGGIDPDRGLSYAIEALGWTCAEVRGGEADEALAWLTIEVPRGSALVGPLDMGHLAHNPRNARSAGADHFLVVLEADERQVRFHDPAGFPFATLPVAAFLLAWRAERVDYARAGYVSRSSFHQVTELSREEMIARALPHVRAGLVADPGGPQRYGSLQALRLCAELLRGDVSDGLAGHLVNFALPLAARRRGDAAAFMDEADNPRAAALLQREAQLFGAAQYPAALGQWSEVADLLERITKAEQELIKVV